jgi:hypothetical protein
MARLLPALVVAALVGFPGDGLAAKVKVWHHCLPGHYDKAQLRGAVVSSEGTLRLSRQLQPLAELDATHVWDIIEDKHGNLFVATGDEGKIFKMTADGKVSVAYESADSQVLCFAAAPDGTIYAGTGPDGHLLRIALDGKVKPIANIPKTYIWSLAVNAAGSTIYAATGPKGKVYQVTPEGKATVFYSTKQDHVLCVSCAPDGTLYAGTDKHGLVYRIDSKGKGFVVYQAPQAEVHRLTVGPDGVYAATSVPSRRGSGSYASSTDKYPSTNYSNALASASRTSTRPVGVDTGQSGSTSSSSKEKEEKVSPAPAAPAPTTGENSLYRIGADGKVREIFREKAMILGFVRQDSRFFVGTGMEGRLFEVQEASRERSEIARLDHGQIHVICRRRDGTMVLGAGDPGKLYVLRDKFAVKGTVTSEVLDAKLMSKWGSLRWKADTPSGTGVTMAVRSGNVGEPDDTWSDWSAEQSDPESAFALAPNARYIQYRLTLNTTNASVTPAVRTVSLRYQNMNLAPEVSGIEVPDLDAVNLEIPKKLKFKWTATDPNEDELTYNVYVRKDGWKNWVLLEDSYEKREYEWDTTTTPEGFYQLKVVASDRKDNAAEDALTGERVSARFAVAHTPPVVTLKVADIDGAQAVIEATGKANLVRLTAASFAVNGKKWVNVFPADGLFDGKSKSFRFKTQALKPGTYVLVLRVRDAAGNTGSADLVFTIPADDESN